MTYRLIKGDTQEILYSNKNKNDFLFIANMIFSDTQAKQIWSKDGINYYLVV